MERFISTTTIVPNVQVGVPIIEFSWYDYTLFTVMLLGSVLVGLYFGCFGSKQESADEYLLGSKKMKAIPVAFSMVASGISGYQLLSVPADVYLYGATYLISAFAILFVSFVTYKLYIPLFFSLQLTSTYEYLEIRFNRTIRSISSILYTLNIFLYLPIIIYVPALAFAQATDINVHFITPVLCGICIFYTTIGGLKAVIWTDTFQFGAMLAAMAGIFYLGLVHAGGVVNIWNVSKAGGRLDIDMDINPFKKDTFWAALIGLSVNWIGYIGVGQGSIQKFISLPTMNECKRTTILMTIGIVLNKTFIVVTGLMMYTIYHDCDPVTSKLIKKADQMIPYFVLDVANKIPGLPGIFIAGVFSASLSTLSAILNSLSGIIYEDFIKPFMPKDISQKSISNILKLIVVLSGIISTSSVFLIENMGNLFPLGTKLTGLAQGPLIGLFTLGMFFPIANAKGALTGALTALGCLSWILIGADHYQSKGMLKTKPKPLSIDGCPFPVNITSSIGNTTIPYEEPFIIYRLSFYYYTVVGAIIVIVVGLIVSYLTRRKDDPPTPKELITPLLQFLVKEENKVSDEKIYYPVEKALNMVKIEKCENNKE